MSQINLKDPFFISSRLLPAVRVADAVISIEYGETTPDKRVRYRYYIDLKSGYEYTAEDLASGVGGGTLRQGMESLLSFLSACGDANDPYNGGGENAGLFPHEIGEWAYTNQDEINSVRMAVELTKDCCLEAA